MPKVIKVTGHRKAMTVRLMLQGPMNRTVYFVDGGTVVSDEFTAHTKNSKKQTHITSQDWQNCKSDWVSKSCYQDEWNAMHPEHKVDRILIPGETKAGKGLAGPSGPAEAPAAGGVDCPCGRCVPTARQYCHLCACYSHQEA